MSALRKPVLLALVLTASTLVVVGLALGRSFYSDWSEQRRIDDLTEKHSDELLSAVEKYRVVLAMGQCIDKTELGLYTTGPALRRLQRYWDDMQIGENVVELTSLDYESVQVLTYTETTASLLAMVRWKEAVDGQNGIEFKNQHTAGGWVKYALQFEDGLWKVADLDACPVQDESCLRELRAE